MLEIVKHGWNGRTKGSWLMPAGGGGDETTALEDDEL